jgi:hypothetical protein
MADDRNRPPHVVGRKRSTHYGRHAEQAEKAWRDVRGADSLGQADFCECQVRSIESFERRE